LSPNASRSEIGSIARIDGEAVLCARVCAAPDKGKANAALTAMIADWLGVAKSSVSVARGVTNRRKTLHIAGDPQELAARLKALLAKAV
jgi:hypothetical protein